MKRIKLVHIVGARPNFIKLAPVYTAFKAYPDIEQVIVHTGQHYDYKMSDIFFEEFGIPEPDLNLNISGHSVLQQIGTGVIRLAEELPKFSPDLVLIYGDINATAYTSVVCSKLNIKTAHIEAGLRSFDKSMPEETNRIITDALSDYFFTPSKEADFNLLKSGIPQENIFFVGNVMIDTLINFLPLADRADYSINVPAEYALVTLHRPSNVDDEANLADILATLRDISHVCPLIFPVHPRIKNKIPAIFFEEPSHFLLTEPMGYLPFLRLQKNARFIITDSGGIQEESTYLGVPCFTLRNNTERPVTVEVGTNVLVGTELANLKNELQSFFNGNFKKTAIPELWDGKASNRIAEILHGILVKQRTHSFH